MSRAFDVAAPREPSSQLRSNIAAADVRRVGAAVVLGIVAFLLVLAAHVAMEAVRDHFVPAVPLSLRALGLALALGTGLFKLASYLGNRVTSSLIVGTAFTAVGVVDVGRLVVLLLAQSGEATALLQVAGRAGWAASTALPLLLLLGMMLVHEDRYESRREARLVFIGLAVLVAVAGVVGPWSRTFPGGVDIGLLAVRPAAAWTVVAYLLTFVFLWRRPDVSNTLDGRWLVFALYLGFLDQTLVAPFWNGVGTGAGTVDAVLEASVYLVAGIGVFIRTVTISREQERAVQLAASEARERARVEEALARQAARLTAANEELGQYAYLASHDLQEPLRMVTNYLQLIERRYGDQLDADGREFIGFAVDGARRMKQLTTDLLRYSRIADDEPADEPVSAAAALDAALQNLDVLITETGADITRGELPAVSVPLSHLTQLFQNLIANAIKFRREGVVPRVRVEAAPERGAWHFSVVDNGIGIDEKYRDRVFGVFQRLHRRDAFPGSGIGLALCRKIVERHGGSIGFTSRVNEGTTFRFSFPMERVARSPLAESEEDPDLQRQVTTLIQRARELI